MLNLNRIELLLKKIDSSNIKELLNTKEFSIFRDEIKEISSITKILEKLNFKLNIVDSFENLSRNIILLTEKKEIPKNFKTIGFREFFKNLAQEFTRNPTDFTPKEIIEITKSELFDSKSVNLLISKNIQKFDLFDTKNILDILKNSDLKTILESRYELLNRESEISNKNFLLFSRQPIDVKSFNSILSFFDSKITQDSEIQPNSHLLLSDSLELEDVKLLHNYSINNRSILYSFNTFLHNLKSLLTFEKLKPFFEKNLVNKIEILKNPIVPDRVIFELITKSESLEDKNLQKIIFSLFIDRFKDKIIEKDDFFEFNFGSINNELKAVVEKLNSFSIKNILLDNSSHINFEEILQRNITEILNENSLSNFKSNLVEQLLNAESKNDFTLLSSIFLAFSNEVFTFIDFSQNIYNYFQFKKSKSNYTNTNENSQIEFFAEFKRLGGVGGVIYKNLDSTELIIYSDESDTIEYLQENLRELKRFDRVSFNNKKALPLFDIKSQNFFDMLG